MNLFRDPDFTTEPICNKRKIYQTKNCFTGRFFYWNTGLSLAAKLQNFMYEC